MNAGAQELRAARAEARADLVRRLFAVAISVGFAATLARMKWVQDGRLPDPGEFNQTIALGTALLATILSWDGPLLTLRDRPLFGFWRFLVNVVLVFIYMFLLMASMHPGCLLWTLATIFVLYVVCDTLAIREHLASYDPAVTSEGDASAARVWNVYAAGFANKPGIQTGPVVTLVWAVYFVLLALIADGRADAHVRTACVFALIGVIGYRLDDGRRQRNGAERYPVERSGAVVAVGLIAAIVYFRLLGSP